MTAGVSGGGSAAWIAVAALILVVMGVVLSVLYYRRRKFERDLELMLWKVSFSDIIFIKGQRFNSEGDPVTRVVGLRAFCLGNTN